MRILKERKTTKKLFYKMKSPQLKNFFI